jgi:C-terminal processing protease CtpA/Prc
VQYKEGLEIRRIGPFEMTLRAGANEPLSLLVPAPTAAVGPGFTWAHRGEFLEVQSVGEGTAAALSGLAAGDAITEVNGKSVKEMDAPSAQAALQGEPGTLYQVKVVAHTGNEFQESVVELIRPAAP